MQITALVKEDFLSAQADETLSQAIGKLMTGNQREVFVFQGKTLLGVLENFFVLRSRIDSAHMQIGKLAKRVPCADPGMDTKEAAALMASAGTAVLGIEKSGKFVGAVHCRELLNSLKNEPEIKALRINDVKIAIPSRVGMDDRIGKALEIMYEEKIDALPVQDEEGGIAGVLSFRDILRKYYAFSLERVRGGTADPLRKTRYFKAEIPDAMSLPVKSFATAAAQYTLSPKETVRAAIEMMWNSNVRNVVVMEKNRVQGILTAMHVLRAIAAAEISPTQNIRFVGFEKAPLEPYQRANVQKIISSEAAKIGRMINNEFVLTVHLKGYKNAKEKNGNKKKQHKYDVHLRLEYPGRMLVGREHDWDIETAVRKATANLKNSIGHQFKARKMRVAMRK